MRVVLCAVALLVPSAAWAERITITAASATYWTATDELEIKVWFDSPLVVPPDYFAFTGKYETGPGCSSEQFFFRSDGWIGRDQWEPFHVAHWVINSQCNTLELSAMGLPEVMIDGRTLTATMPFAMTGLDRPLFDFSTTVIRESKSHGLDGFSAIDERNVVTPEPSSVALASFGVVALLFHSGRLPRLRQRRRERHRRREPAGETVCPV